MYVRKPIPLLADAIFSTRCYCLRLFSCRFIPRVYSIEIRVRLEAISRNSLFFCPCLGKGPSGNSYFSEMGKLRLLSHRVHSTLHVKPLTKQLIAERHSLGMPTPTRRPSSFNASRPTLPAVSCNHFSSVPSEGSTSHRLR